MRRGILTVSLLMVAAACGGGGATPTTVDPTPVTSPQPPTDPPTGFVMAENPGAPADVSATETGELVVGNIAFAFDLLAAVAGDENVIVSPHSIAAALTMTYAGARGTTADEMRLALHITQPDEVAHAARGELGRTLVADPVGVAGDEGDPFGLDITNSLWGQADYPFLEEFLDTLAANYEAGMNLVDFVTAAEEARVSINSAVEEQTRGRITDLIPEGLLNPLTRLVLVNAIWFQGTWEQEFSPDQTEDVPFTLLDGTEVTVPTMHGSVEVAHFRGDGYQSVRLPYVGDASMVVIVPDEGRLGDVVAGLAPERLAADAVGAEFGLVQLAIPLFEFRTELDMVPPLESLGIETAFIPPPGDGSADFSGMNGQQTLFVSAVLHQAFVSVDEEGTEAAAATAVVMEDTSAPMELATLNIDRPFVFLIQHDLTGEILFVGQVTDPRS